MTRTKSTYLALIAVLLAPIAANADPIAYTYAGAGLGDDGESWTIDGTFVFDESSLVSGVDIIADLVSWTVSWTNGVITNTNSSDAGSTINIAVFFLNPDLSVDELVTFFCSNTCGAGDPDGAFLIETAGFWIATIDVETCCATGEGSWSGPTAVPEPGTFALFGLGLLALSLARRRV